MRGIMTGRSGMIDHTSEGRKTVPNLALSTPDRDLATSRSLKPQSTRSSKMTSSEITPTASTPEPYYSDDFVTMYHGECQEVLNALNVRPALILTDPPYGMAYKPLRGSDGSKRWVDGVRNDGVPFDPTWLLSYRRLILFGANWYSSKLPDSGGWIVWDKTPKGVKNGFHASHAELAWTNLRSSILKVSLQWGGEARNGEPHLHPTQKPVGLMRELIETFSEPGDLILDPYMGSGPVAQACSETGRRYVGIELEEKYLKVAVRRLDQGVLNFGGVA